MSNHGVFPGMDRERYDRTDAVNFSTLKIMGRSAAHYRHAILQPRKDTAALKFGRATHLAVFEPERFRALVVTWTGGARRGKAWETFEEEHAGLEILTEDETEKVLALQQSVRANPIAARYLAGGKAEVSMRWSVESSFSDEIPPAPVECKGRVDFIADAGAIVDLKTTRDASQSGFGRAAWNYRYHMQAAFYADGHAYATSKRLPFVFVAVESEPPFAVQVYRVPDAILQVGRDEYQALLSYLSKCRHESRWPAYGDDEMELTLPGWVMPNEDEDVAELDLLIGE